MLRAFRRADPGVSVGAAGFAHEWDRQSMVEALAPLIDGGKIKLYCPESNVSQTWTDKETHFLDVAAARPLGRLSRHRAAVKSLDWSRDSESLISASSDRHAILWDFNLESWKSKACAIVDRRRSIDEWDRFVGSAASYEPVCPPSTSD